MLDRILRGYITYGVQRSKEPGLVGISPLVQKYTLWSRGYLPSKIDISGLAEPDP